MITDCPKCGDTERDGLCSNPSCALITTWRERAEKAELALGISQHAASAEARHADGLQAELSAVRRVLAHVECRNCGCLFSADPAESKCPRSDHATAFAALGGKKP